MFALAANLFHPPLGLWPSQIRYCQSAFFNDLQFCNTSDDHFGLVLTSCLSQFRLERSDPTRHLHTQIKRKLSKLFCKKMRSKSFCHISMFNCRVRIFLLFNTFSYLLFIVTCLIWDFYNQPLGIKFSSELLEALERVPTLCTLYMNRTCWFA